MVEGNRLRRSALAAGTALLLASCAGESTRPSPKSPITCEPGEKSKITKKTEWLSTFSYRVERPDLPIYIYHPPEMTVWQPIKDKITLWKESYPKDVQFSVNADVSYDEQKSQNQAEQEAKRLAGNAREVFDLPQSKKYKNDAYDGGGAGGVLHVFAEREVSIKKTNPTCDL